jgi:hypothetical protein
MANFDARTASNGPGVTDAAAVRSLLTCWYAYGEDLAVEVEGPDDDHTVIEFYGYGWPEMVRKPEGGCPGLDPMG